MAPREANRRILPYWLRFLAVTAVLLLCTAGARRTTVGGTRSGPRSRVLGRGAWPDGHLPPRAAGGPVDPARTSANSGPGRESLAGRGRVGAAGGRNRIRGRSSRTRPNAARPGTIRSRDRPVRRPDRRSAERTGSATRVCPYAAVGRAVPAGDPGSAAIPRASAGR